MNRTKGSKASAVKHSAKKNAGKKDKSYPKIVRFGAGLLVLVLVVASFNAVIPALIDMVTVQAADSLEYYPADLKLWDYYDSKNNKVFDSFNKALQDEAYYGTESYVNAAGTWDSSNQYLFSYKTGQDTYYPLYLGLQYNDKGTSYPYRIGDWDKAATYKYSLAANSNAKSGNAAAQNLVDSTLSGGLVTQGNGKVTLPYFNSSFLSTNSIGAEMGNYTFKFKKRTGNEEDAGYYVYDSANDGLNKDTSASTFTVDPNGTKSPNRSGYGGPVYGFFPLGNYNFGFGAKFDIKFTMTVDGNTAGGQPMKFTFKGDDDVWVFIDGVLVLDIGGAHGQVSGSIDFSNGNTTVSSVKNESTFSFDNRLNNVGSNVSTFSENKLGTLNSIGLFGDPTAIHTMSVFYLERGELESNCKITFNFDPADTLTIQNTVKTDNVNDFFKTKTAIVAKHEAIQYQVQNNGGNTGLDSPDDEADLTEVLSSNLGGSNTEQKVYNVVYHTYKGDYVLDDTQTGLKPGASVKVFDSVSDTKYSSREADDKPANKDQFLGWSTSPESESATYGHGSVMTLPSIPSGASSPVTYNLYAVYTTNIVISYIYNDGTTTKTETQTVAKGSKVALPSSIDDATFNDNYTLMGWTKTSGSTTVEYSKGYRYQTLTTDTTLTFYAVTQANLHVNYYDSDGSALSPSVARASALEGANFALNSTATKTGKALFGWSQTKNATYPDDGFRAGDTVTMTAALGALENNGGGLYAVWVNSFDSTEIYYPVVMVVKKSGLTTSESTIEVDQKVNNGFPYGFADITSGQIYMLYTRKLQYTNTNGNTNNWVKVNYKQFFQDLTDDKKVDNTGGDAGSGVVNMKAGYLYLLDWEYDGNGKQSVDRWTVSNSALTGSPESMARVDKVNSDFIAWFTAYGGLFEKLQEAAVRLTELQGNLTASNLSAYNNLCEKYTAARTEYIGASYSTSNTGTLETKLSDLTTALGNAPAPTNYAPLPSAAQPQSQSLFGSILDIFQNNSADNAETIEIPSDDTSSEEEVELIESEVLQVPSAGVLLNVNAAGGDKAGHWAGSNGTFANVAATNYRLKYIDGTASVVRQTSSGGNFNLLGGQSGKFSLQFKRDSGLKVAQTGNSYLLSNVEDIGTAGATGSDSIDSRSSVALLSKRYQTTWTIEDNKKPTSNRTASVEGFSAYDSNAAINNTGAFDMQYLGADTAQVSQMVDLTVTYVNQVRVSDLTVTKALGTTAGAATGEEKTKYESQEFEFEVTFKNVFGGAGTIDNVNFDDAQEYVGTDAVYYVTNTSGTTTTTTVETGEHIKIKAGESFTIQGVPVDTVFSITEILPDDDETITWSLEEISPSSNATVDGLTITKTVSMQAGTATGTDLLVSYTPYTTDTSGFSFTYTNDVTKNTAYLILGKQINHLYYNGDATNEDTKADSDDPAGLLNMAGATVGGQSPGNDDVNGYQAATNAKQTFLYRIQVYEPTQTGYESSPSETFYETISCDTVNTLKYRVIKANPTYQYVVTELTDWSWKYQLSDTNGVVVTDDDANEIDGVQATIIKFDPDSKKTVNGTEYEYIAEVDYSNVKNDTTRNVEGDTYIRQNIADKPAA